MDSEERIAADTMEIVSSIAAREGGHAAQFALIVLNVHSLFNIVSGNVKDEELHQYAMQLTAGTINLTAQGFRLREDQVERVLSLIRVVEQRIDTHFNGSEG